MIADSKIFYGSFLFALVLAGCGDKSDLSWEDNITDQGQPAKVETYHESCGYGSGNSIKIVRHDSVKNLPEISYLQPLPSLIMTSRFECRYGSFHWGIDFAGIEGAPIAAVASGVVRFSGSRRDTGNTIVIFHEESGVESLYGHGSANLVSKGDIVESGQIIQKLGNTEISTGPHLHFATMYQGAYIDPCLLIQCPK